MLPSGMKDFTKACASQDQEADGRHSERIKRPQAVSCFRRMARRWLRLVNAPFEPRSFRFAERIAKAGEFLARQEALTPVFGIALDRLGGVAGGHHFVTPRRPI